MTLRPECHAGIASPDDLAEALVRYFDVAPFEDVKVAQPGGGVEVQRFAASPPMPADFAEAHGFTAADLHDWATATLPGGQPAYPRLARAYVKAQRVQARRIRQGVKGGWYARACVGMFLAACRWRPMPAPVAARSR